jgi:hypothetical protein
MLEVRPAKELMEQHWQDIVIFLDQNNNYVPDDGEMQAQLVGVTPATLAIGVVFRMGTATGKTSSVAEAQPIPKINQTPGKTDHVKISDWTNKVELRLGLVRGDITTWELVLSRLPDDIAKKPRTLMVQYSVGGEAIYKTGIPLALGQARYELKIAPGAKQETGELVVFFDSNQNNLPDSEEETWVLPSVNLGGLTAGLRYAIEWKTPPSAAAVWVVDPSQPPAPQSIQVAKVSPKPQPVIKESTIVVVPAKGGLIDLSPSPPLEQQFLLSAGAWVLDGKTPSVAKVQTIDGKPELLMSADSSTTAWYFLAKPLETHHTKVIVTYDIRTEEVKLEKVKGLTTDQVSNSDASVYQFDNAYVSLVVDYDWSNSVRSRRYSGTSGWKTETLKMDMTKQNVREDSVLKLGFFLSKSGKLHIRNIVVSYE